MRKLRQYLLYLAYAIGTWLLVSFGGAMFNSANAAFWADSLMWALLSFTIVSPVLVFLCTPRPDASVSERQTAFTNENTARLCPRIRNHSRNEISEEDAHTLPVEEWGPVCAIHLSTTSDAI